MDVKHVFMVDFKNKCMAKNTAGVKGWVPKEEYDRVAKESELWYQMWLDECKLRKLKSK